MYTQDLTAAPATSLVLTILSEGESYGYAIVERVRVLSGGRLEWADSLVYPLFHRLRRLGYLTTEWRTLPEGRRRNYYAITDDGRAALAGRNRHRVTAMQAMSGLWVGSPWLLTAT
jgi:PadR family transcriptional regulator, regulatory protein PadR